MLSREPSLQMTRRRHVARLTCHVMGEGGFGLKHVVLVVHVKMVLAGSYRPE